MMQDVERIAVPTARQFVADHIRPQRPVVLRDFYAGQDVSRIDTVEKAIDRHGALSVDAGQQFFGDFLRYGDLATHRLERMTLRDYFARVAGKPGTELSVSGQPTPAEIREPLRMPDLCFYQCDVSRIVSKWFVGTAGQTAHLHFDGDHQHVILYQMVGRRRVYLVHPRWSGRLFPIFYTSAVVLERFPEDERRRFLESVDAWECTLEPGEALYWPPHFWHYIEYLEPTIAFNTRFGRGRFATFLDRFHPDAYMQGIGSKLVHDDVVERDYRGVIADLETVDAMSFPSGLDKYLYVRGRLAEHYKTVCSDYLPLDCCVPYADAEERIMRRYVALGEYYPVGKDAAQGARSRRGDAPRADGWPR